MNWLFFAVCSELSGLISIHYMIQYKHKQGLLCFFFLWRNVLLLFICSVCDLQDDCLTICWFCVFLFNV